MPTEVHESEIWLGLTEAAEKLGVAPVTLRRWADEGAVPHMITPGGHRRFTASEIEAFTEARRRSGPGASPEHLWAEIALKQTRAEMVDQQGEQWLVTYDREEREHKRLLGRRLLGVLLRYVAADEESEDLLEEARAIGQSHALMALEAGLPLSVAIQATMFFRDTLLEVAFDLPATFRGRPERGKRLLSRINTLINAFQLTMVEAYEGSPRLD